MPTYDIQCSSCGYQEDVFRRVAEVRDGKVACDCGLDAKVLLRPVVLADFTRSAFRRAEAQGKTVMDKHSVEYKQQRESWFDTDSSVNQSKFNGRFRVESPAAEAK